MTDLTKAITAVTKKITRPAKLAVLEAVGLFDTKLMSDKKKSSGSSKTIINLPSYVKSSDVKTAEKAYNEWKSSMPKTPELSYTDQLNKLVNSLYQRKFSYDYKTDSAYIAQKNELMEQGRLAMEDTAGNAAANTGGYSNSYAVTAANQAYNNYVKQVGEVIPELYEAAYNRYRDETDELYDRIELLSSLNNDEWDRYSDALSAYYDEGKMLLDELSQVSDEDYQKYYNYYKLMISQQ